MTTLTEPRVARLRPLRLILLACACAGLLPAPASAVKFWHATLGPMEIYASDSPESTRAFVCELLEVRRQVQELVAPVLLPNPRIQIVVFNRLKDFKEFAPAGTVTERDMVTVAGFSNGDYGLTAALVRGSGAGFEFGRDVILWFYAYHLVLSAVPDAPLWIQIGLPECLATTECRNNRLFIGGNFMDHLGHVRPSALTPLARLMDDQEMRQYFGAPRHDNLLYHQSWALWQRWLTGADTRRREQIRRLFAAIREGAKGDLAQVAASFGETPEAIEAAHRQRGDFPVVMVNPDAGALVPGLNFQPATELDGRYALAMLFGRTGKGLGAFGYELLQQADAHPDSPWPVEALAALEMGAGDSEGAARRWERARELNTDNPYAYLLPVQQALADRIFYYTLRPQLPDAAVTQWRGLLDRCTRLDPGYAEAHFYRVLLEAFAPQPDRVAVDAAEHSGTLAARPMGWVYLAIARWRLGQMAEAHQLIARVQARPNMDDSARHNLTVLDASMRQREESKASR